jgi:hypothetical protein
VVPPGDYQNQHLQSEFWEKDKAPAGAQIAELDDNGQGRRNVTELPAGRI